MTPQNQRLPEEVYVRRRVAAGVALLVAIALIIWGLVALAGGGDEEEPQTPPADTTQAAQASDTTATATSEPAPEDSGTPTSSPAESSPAESESESEPGESSTSTSGKKPDCTLADLQISVSSDRPSYNPDTSPTFYMQVRNPTEVDCEIDLSEHTMRFEVYNLASNQRIWSDVDCNAPIGTGDETFVAGEERNFQAVWSRTTSAPDRCDDRKMVPAGAFFLHGVIGQNASNSHTFNLR